MIPFFQKQIISKLSSHDTYAFNNTVNLVQLNSIETTATSFYIKKGHVYIVDNRYRHEDLFDMYDKPTQKLVYQSIMNDEYYKLK
jgi:hypothetical protein